MGDPVCWMASTCLACGRFLEPDELAGSACPHCAAALPAAPPPGESTGTGTTTAAEG